MWQAFWLSNKFGYTMPFTDLVIDLILKEFENESIIVGKVLKWNQ